MLESLAERLLKLERLTDDDIYDDTFADARNDAIALRPLYVDMRERALALFGQGILSSSLTIGELDAMYQL
ncbi:MAG: hypothetical protein ABW321_00665 [Polyangiales bacterium]